MKTKFRVFMVGFITVCILTIGIACFAGTASKNIEVFFNKVNLAVNGKAIQVDNILYNGTTYVPIRAVAETLGKYVGWDGSSNTASINDKGIMGEETALKKNNNLNNTGTISKNVEVFFNNVNLAVNGNKVQADNILYNGTTYVPIRAVAESLGKDVGWDGSTNTASINNKVTSTNNNIITGDGKDNKSDVVSDTGAATGIKPVVEIIMADDKKMVLELYPEYAPKTVENFLKLAKAHFYDGLKFHRIVKDFMIQGGDPKGDGTGGAEDKIKGEFAANGFDKNTLKHTKGVISMARSASPNSASSQFFIMTANAAHLDGNYAAFGKVIEGLDVLDELANTPVIAGGEGSKPKTDVVIKKINVVKDLPSGTLVTEVKDKVVAKDGDVIGYTVLEEGKVSGIDQSYGAYILIEEKSTYEDIIKLSKKIGENIDLVNVNIFFTKAAYIDYKKSNIETDEFKKNYIGVYVKKKASGDGQITSENGIIWYQSVGKFSKLESTMTDIK